MPYSDPKTLKEYKRLWNMKYKKQCNEYGVRNYYKYRQRYIDNARTWYNNNKKHHNAMSKLWYENNKEKRMEYQRQYRLRKKIFNTIKKEKSK